jgi:hypothetical protein
MATGRGAAMKKRVGIICLGAVGLLAGLAAPAYAVGPAFWTGPNCGMTLEVREHGRVTIPYVVADLARADVQCYLRIYKVKGNIWDAKPDDWTRVSQEPMGQVRAVRTFCGGVRDLPFSYTWTDVDLAIGTYWCRVAATDGSRWAVDRLCCGLEVTSPVRINKGAGFTRDATVSVDYLTVPAWKYFMISDFASVWPNVWQPIPAGDDTMAWNLRPGDGKKTVYMRFCASPGGSVTARRCSIVLDTHGPTTKAPYPARGTKGRMVALRLRVDDALSPTASVTIVIRRGRTIVETLRAVTIWKGWLATRRFACDLPKGRYTFTVMARDLAGNEQAKAGSNTLTVY